MSERISPQDETAIREWAALVLDESRREVDRGLWMCAYTDALPTHSVRSQMLTLLAELDVLRGEVERLRAALLDASREIDRWGHGDIHYGDMPRDPGVLAALAAIDEVLFSARGVIGEEPNGE